MIILIYIIKMISCTAVLAAYYYCFLRNRSFHTYNRYFLLMIFVLSIILPLLKFPFLEFTNERLPVLKNFTPRMLPEAVFTFAQQQDKKLALLPVTLITFYIITALFMLIKLTRSICYLFRLRKHYPSMPLSNATLFFTNEPNTPFTFFKWIFWNKKIDLSTATGQQVLEHELYHVHQKHSLDIILAECAMVIFWFNPFFFYIKKELQTIHEFLADQSATRRTGKIDYAALLLIHAIAVKKHHLSHPFFQNEIKRRITMITAMNKTSFAYIRRVMCLPILFLLFLACSRGVDHVKQHTAKTATTELNNPEERKWPAGDTIQIRKGGLEALLMQKSNTKNISINTAGDKTYLTFDDGTVYTISQKEMEALQSGKDYTDYDQTFTKLEIEPGYPGGTGSWIRYLIKTLRYPQEAINKKIQGTVVIQFIVERNGDITAISAISGPELLKSEAIRVIKESGRWMPGIQDGVKVKAYRRQPITFRLAEAS